MPCGDYDSYWQFLAEGQFFDAAYCPFGDTLGGPLFAVMFFGGIGIAVTIYSDSPIMPLVLGTLLASVVVSQLTAGVAQFVGIAIVLIIAAIGYKLVVNAVGGR